MLVAKNQNVDTTAAGAAVSTVQQMLGKEMNGYFNGFGSNSGGFFTEPDVNLKIIKEPVDMWRNLNGNNLLDMMYLDEKNFNINFMERSLFSAKYGFVENLIKS